MSHNLLSGTLTSEERILRNLRELHLNSNLFTGKLPKEIGNLKMLQKLIVPNNICKGEIPPSIVHLKSFETLNMRNNTFTMGIPPLKSLAFSNNKLNGTIPTAIQHMEKLEELDLETGLVTTRARAFSTVDEVLWAHRRDPRMDLFDQGSAFSRLNSEVGLEHLSPTAVGLIKEQTIWKTFPVFDPTAILQYIDYFSGEIPTTFPLQTRILSLRNNRFSGACPRT
ncbi:receptor-like protein 12 [Cucumis melo var. makuwa]|uniref:Receptor-like protein 12 n=1 Tax=Cucumis melo var. makuwa TaxID=1194695 RepID=A0A5D3CDM7_CUCMM|nr:receptor-like protein 12 [Cucumis melo var. makuwa]TYK09973.1 receptor-like protein 12 [Cucumis melo var. makuwa]